MISTTNGIPSNDQYPATIGGSYDCKILEYANGNYSITVFGLTTNSFDVTIADSLVQSDGEFSSELLFDYLMDEMQNASSIGSSTSSYNGSMTAEFQQYNENTEKYESNLSGSFMIEEVNQDSTTYTFHFNKVDGQLFEFKINKTESAVSSGIDAGKLLRWLLKKMKEALCPECL